MEQEFITVSNIQLAYLVHNSSAKETIFFIHGNSISARSWKPQLTSELFKDYRLIALDLPAHGDSEASPNPEEDYNVQGLGAIVANFIHALGNNAPYILVSLSLGTNILAESLAFGLQPEGIVLAGSCIVGGKYTLQHFALPDTNVHVVFTNQSPQEEVAKYADQVMTSSDEALKAEFIADYYKVQLPFRDCLMAGIQTGRFSDEIALVQSIEKPLLVIFGKDEQIINCNYLDDAKLNLWKDTIFKIPGAGHLVHSDQPDAFNNLLSAYAKDIL